MVTTHPRLVIAGAGGDAGKTLVALALAAAWRSDGLDVAAFKKGPDYIDAAWLSRVASRPARNLDVHLMGEDAVLRSFAAAAEKADVSVLEGNRGVLDGAMGHSTASLARLLCAPAVLVIDITKTTRTAAALAAGVRALEPGLDLKGAILNRSGGRRHQAEASRALTEEAGLRVLGVVPRLSGETPLPDRHLGLVPPEEHGRMGEVLARLARVARENLDLGLLLETARGAGPLPAVPPAPVRRAVPGPRVRVGVMRDAAFTFYYPENLEALEAAGAEIVPVSALADPGLPELDLLYLGGGFPETHAAALAANVPMLTAVRAAAESGLPMYAECGGLIYLSRSVEYRGCRSRLAGVLPVDIAVSERPAGHGYGELLVDGHNPFFAPGTVLRGHEFHYGALARGAEQATYCASVRRGAGCHAGRDGIVAGRVFATWLHLHALGQPEWALALVRAAREEIEVETCSRRSNR